MPYFLPRENNMYVYIYIYIPGVAMTLKKWGHYPKLRGHGPIFEGSWRLILKNTAKLTKPGSMGGGTIYIYIYR